MISNNKFFIHRANLKLYIYILFGFIFLLTIGIRAVKGEIDFEFYADSETYIDYVKEIDTIRELLLSNPNLIGPTLILKSLNSNFIAVFLFNALIIIFFFNQFSRIFKLNRHTFFSYLLVSPMFFSSLITINKEVLTLLSITFFFKYYNRKSFIFLLLSIISAIFVRWQMLLFIIALTFLFNKINPFKEMAKLSLILLLVFVSILYYFNLDQFENFNAIAQLGQETATEGTGLYNYFINIQNSSPVGYVFAFIPKFLFLFIGLIARYSKFLDKAEFYNYTIVFIQSLLNLFTLFKLYRNKIYFNNIFLFSAIVYCIIFSLSPIYSPRYLFTAYILMAISLSVPEVEVNKKIKF